MRNEGSKESLSLILCCGTPLLLSLLAPLNYTPTPGMMDAAYFTGRKELLEFFNDLLDLNLTKIEQTAPGAIACQMTELIFPGSIPLSRVSWEARADFEFIQNYKLLQIAFTKHHVQRFVDVNALIRGKYQDNLEFCQWMKAFYDQSGVFREDYDPIAARARGKGGKKFNEQHKKGGRSVRPRPAATARPAAAARPAPAAKPVAKPVPASGTIRGSQPLRERRESNKPEQLDAVADANLLQENAELKEKVGELEANLGELETNVATLEEAVMETETERQFYFDKLRNVEVMLQVYQENSEESDPEHLIEKVFKILYAVRIGFGPCNSVCVPEAIRVALFLIHHLFFHTDCRG
jgi:RP/EB family microtubule-associated protein